MRAAGRFRVVATAVRVTAIGAASSALAACGSGAALECSPGWCPPDTVSRACPPASAEPSSNRNFDDRPSSPNCLASVWRKEFQAFGVSIATGADDRLLVVAAASDVVDLGAGPISPVSQGDSDLIVASFDPGGELEWTRRYGTGRFEATLAVAPTGDVWVAGSLDRDTDFGAGLLRAAAFLLKLDRQGRLLLSGGIGQLFDRVSLSDLAVAEGGDLLVAGHVGNMTALAGTSLIKLDARTDGGPDAFVVRLSESGEQRWARRLTPIAPLIQSDGIERAADQVTINALRARSDGAAVIAGIASRFVPGVDLGTTVSQSYLQVLDSSGAPTLTWSAATQATVYVAVPDSRDDFVLSGVFSGAVDLGGGVLQSTPSAPVNAPPNGDMFLARLDGSAQHVWSRSFGGPGGEGPGALAVDACDSIILGGSFDGTLDLGGGILRAESGGPQLDPTSDAVIASFDRSGGHLCSRSFGDSGDQFAQALAVDSRGSVVLAGAAAAGDLATNRVFVEKFER